MIDDGPINYRFSKRDSALLHSAALLLHEVATAKFLRPAQLISVAKLMHVMSNLPKPPTTELNVTVSVVSPRHTFGEIETFHWWKVGVEDDQLSIESGGHFYRQSTGGDTFTTMSWMAAPGYETAFTDYSDDLAIVPDVRSFPEAVASLNLATEDYKVEVEDPDNPLLEEYLEDEPEEDSDESDDEDEEAEVPWRITPRDDAEAKLAALVKPEEVESHEAQFAYDADHCGGCGASLESHGMFVDGRLKDDAAWANLCAQCFSSKGAGIGWGSGQLYAKQPDGAWRMVAGFDTGGESETG